MLMILRMSSSRSFSLGNEVEAAQSLAKDDEGKS